MCGRNVCSGESVAISIFSSVTMQNKYEYDNNITIIIIIVVYRITCTRSHLYTLVGQNKTRILCVYNLYYCPHASGPGDDGEIPKKRFRDAFRLPGEPELRVVQHGLSSVVNIHFI